MGDSTFSGGWIFAFLIIAVIFGWGNGGVGGGNATLAGYATVQDVNSAIAAQTNALNQQSILLSSSNNNYETARLIDNQTMAMLNTQNSNLINAIQGYNSLGMSLQNGFASVNQSLASLGAQMNECCCSVKTMLLENRLQDTQQALADARNVAVNAEQSAYLLNVMGKWIANAPAAA